MRTIEKSAAAPAPAIAELPVDLIDPLLDIEALEDGEFDFRLDLDLPIDRDDLDAAEW